MEGEESKTLAVNKAPELPVTRRPSWESRWYQRLLLGASVVSIVTALVMAALLLTSDGDRAGKVELLLQSLLAAAGFGGIAAALRRADTHDAQLALQQQQLDQAQAQFTEEQLAGIRRSASERFARATEQLGSANTMARIGAVYALEAVVRDDPSYHWPGVEVLTSFVREHEQRPWGSVQLEIQQTAAAAARDVDSAITIPLTPGDVQAAITVLGRRDASLDGKEHMDFDQADLRGVTFKGNFDRASFLGAILQMAGFYGGSARQAFFTRADLTCAILGKVDLTGAVFDKADLLKATFPGAILDHARVSTARNTTPEQFNEARSVVGLQLAPTPPPVAAGSADHTRTTAGMPAPDTASPPG